MNSLGRNLTSARHRSLATCLAIAGMSACFGGCSKEPNANGNNNAPLSPPALTSNEQPWFRDTARERNVQFTWKSGHEQQFLLPEITGGGGALFDYNNDGRLDLYLVQGGSIKHPDRKEPNTLLRNRGDGTFESVENAGGANDRGYGMGAACGDIDNDGWIDLYVTNLGPNVLYRNNGDGTFANITITAGIGHGGWSTGATFLDYDRDGFLDLYVCNYMNWSIETEHECNHALHGLDYCSPATYAAPAMDVLYRNNGDLTFRDITIDVGIDAAYGTGLGVIAADFNRDGWIDIFIANDGMRNQLWTNQQDGSFTDNALIMGCAYDEEGKAKAGMGVVAMDFDDDGDTDVIVGNLQNEADSLFLHEGTHFFDATSRVGLRAATRPHTTFGLGWLDFDNDGRLDLLQVHGSVVRSDRTWSDADPYAEPNLLFRGEPDSRFVEVKHGFEPISHDAPPLIHTSRAAIFGDIDNDGGVDAVIINRDAPAYVLHNVKTNRGNWSRLRVMEHNRDALGATVTLELGERTILRTVHAGFGYLASNDPRVHIGLGEAEGIHNVRVQWADGTIEQFGSYEAGKDHQVVRGTGESLQLP